MERRQFIRKSFTSAAVASTGAGLLAGGLLAANAAVAASSPLKAEPFKLKFSPDFGIFAKASGNDPVDQIKWGYDNGFRAWECTGLKRRSKEEQQQISNVIQQLGMEFGQFVGTMTFKDVTFAGRNVELREQVLKEVRESVEIAKRMNTKFIHNVLGMADPALAYDFQMVNAVELLKQIADIYEPHGIIMAIPQAYSLAKAVNRPAIKMLYDFYHVQIEEGNLLPALDYAYDEIAYIQVGDTPGRNEPTTGEINFPNVMKHLYEKGYRGFIGLEHGTKLPGKEGATAALKAYRSIDLN